MWLPHRQLPRPYLHRDVVNIIRLFIFFFAFTETAVICRMSKLFHPEVSRETGQIIAARNFTPSDEFRCVMCLSKLKLKRKETCAYGTCSLPA